MKKKLLGSVLCSCFILAGAITAYASASSASIALQVHENWIESSAVGLATRAEALVINSEKSTGNVTMRIYAAWDGWPYTCEQTNVLTQGFRGTFVEKQSKSSSFRLRLESGGGVAALGKITI